ncbi:DNA repair protein RAD50 isoform X1 [Telopea speciosissima]|uniref:DNA repair protein RAD50 isoform X1 n=1 Tax=Telopea speciosissima TaxID=54955 RepID=UPI001CC496AB|nr:DNA repair protein RAD50 isoform X1 [Telopea speciosissima]XP_043719531.1 DNA repair protein RAD50 isoform X1 [Telopea speciosissima]
MSTIDKMLIKGIRSFDPENKHVITFFTPLTLIVGPNGAGKTTIIECLKLSCTGELPPNARSGQSFIHDPKVAGETETKAQIKLRFKTAAGKDVVCVRSFQLTQKASKMEYKAIESVLQTINPHTGEKVCLSYRCADMDREIPALMGISKAILENVIFVHQDEANWPLQDPSTLKKKFDDIFSATRYTKALEVIKKLHKEQAQEIKTYKLKLENLQTLKDAAYKLRENIAQNEESSESLKTQMHELEKNVQSLEAKIHHAEAMLEELKNLQDQISKKTGERNTLFKQEQDQYAALEEENEDTDEELQEWQTKFEERIALLETKIGKLEREMHDTEERSSFLVDTSTKSNQEIGKLQNEAEVFISLRQKQDLTIQRIFEKHNLGSLPSAPFSYEVSCNLINRLKMRLMDLERDLLDKKKSNEVELKALWDSYDAANKHFNGLELQKHNKIEAKEGILSSIKKTENARDLEEQQLFNFNLSDIDEREKTLQMEYERKGQEFKERKFEENIQQLLYEIRNLDKKIKTLNQEKDFMARDSDNRVRLNVKKEELETSRKKHRKIIDEHKDKIRRVLKGRLPLDKDLKKEVTQALEALKKEFSDLESKYLEADKEVKVGKAKIEDVESSLSKFQKEMVAKKKFIESKLQFLFQQSFDIDSFPQVVNEAKEKRDIKKSKYNIADGMRQMFDPFERVARAHHVCPCCERSFSPEEEDEFVKKQRVKATSSAEHMKLLAGESSNADSLFQQLDKLRMVYEEYIKLGKETIPQAQKNLQQLREDLDQKSQALDDVVGVLAHLKAEKDSVETLVEPVGSADTLFHEMQNLQKVVDDLEYALDARGEGVKSVEEMQLQLNTLQSRRDSLDYEVQKLRDEKDSMSSDLSNVEMRWRNAREEKLKAANILNSIKKAEEELEHLVEEKNQVDLEEKHLGEALIISLKEKDRLYHEYEAMKTKLDYEYDSLAELKRSYNTEVEKLLEYASQIKEYNDSKKGERLKELQEKLLVYESQLQNCKARKHEISVELDKSKELRRSQEKLKRNIDDNLKYRKTKAELDGCTHEIESLEDRMLKIGGFSTFEANKKKYVKERERLLEELNKCRGTLSVYQKNISDHKAELKQAKYNDIDKRYFNQLIQLKTTEMANKDLDRYYNALDKALMRFHTMKMEEINKIIRELWQQTYRGQDIDYISIHSDSESCGTRSYSYRVLMQTGDTELEMRGRCSAGQKVLASLIIRLALAETFCLNCGILALDEPTTNLDCPNAESLAAALLRIMEDRKNQENFQLIVITHDERFAQLIGQRQHAERYYRVAKDEFQHSIIEAQAIFD